MMNERLCCATMENPDHIIIHVGTNDLSTNKQPDVISEDIVESALKLKADSCDLSDWNIVSRDSQYRKIIINHRLKDLYKEENLYDIDNSNTINTKCFYGSKLHLDMKVTKILFNNFAEVISNILH